MKENLLRTPLHAEHVRLGARMVPFAGWDMPVQYKSIIQEHRSVRESAGIFDVSHMGEFRISGSGATAYLQHLTPNDVSALQIGAAQYSCLLREDGGMIDDIFIYRLESSYLVVVNAANVAKVANWFAAHPAADAQLVNESDHTALMAVQGPLALGALQPLVDGNLGALARRSITPLKVAGVPSLVARTGYTGEDGVEIFMASDDGARVWRAILEQAATPVQPCGLGARDTLRLEAGNLLYGHDMDEMVNPVEAGLNFILKIEKGDFIGRDAVIRAKTEGVSKRLVGFEMVERGVPRSEFSIEWEGRTVGRVTSGSYAPTLDRNIGLGYVEPGLAIVGQELNVVIRERGVRARVVKLPFYRARGRQSPRPA